MTEQSKDPCREAFEYEQKSISAGVFLSKTSSGEYCQSRMQERWETWKSAWNARAALSAQQAGCEACDGTDRTELHPDDIAVEKFSDAMKDKLAKKRAEGRGGWEDKGRCSAEYLSQLLIEHVAKGDPIDVANLAMMLHSRGERIISQQTMPAADDVREAIEYLRGEFAKGFYSPEKDRNSVETIIRAARCSAQPLPQHVTDAIKRVREWAQTSVAFVGEDALILIDYIEQQGRAP